MCRELKYSHPDELLEKLTSTQLADWEAYDKIEPIGEWRADYRMACIASTITNGHIRTNGKRGARLTEPKDFMPNWDITNPANRKRQSTEDLKAALLSMAKSHNKAYDKKQLHQNPPKKG